MRVILSINLARENADRTVGSAITNSVTNALRRDGVSLQDTPVFRNSALNGVFANGRSVVKVGVVVRGSSIDRQTTRLITAACVNAILHSAGLLQFAPRAIGVLPPDGSGEGRVELFGPVAGVKRTVIAGDTVPDLSTDNELFSSTVTQTTENGIAPGTTVPSGLSTAASNAASAASDYKVPIMIGLAIVGLAAVGYAIRSVR